MRIGLTGQQAALRVLARTGMASLGVALALALGACTTVEGTNAMTDIGTFEREVMISTARGFGLVPGETPKEEPTSARAPLVLPASGQSLPAPQQAAAVAQLPANSDTVRIDTTNLTEADIQRLRNAKVVDLRSLSGRPLTEAEARMLTARMQAANIAVQGSAQRPLYLPPDEYFTRVGNSELVCSTPSGEIVSINDPKCPPAIREALKRISNGQQVTSSGPLGSKDASLTDSDIGN
jgi:hypothetical protein